MASRPGVNLRNHVERIITKERHEEWPRLLQNLRASCATDWVERYPSHVVAKWLGHSPEVATQHYLMSRDHHFADVVNGAVKVPPATVAEGPGGVASCDAICDSADATQGSIEPHETTEPAVATRVTAGSSKVTPVARAHPRQEAAHKNSRQGP